MRLAFMCFVRALWLERKTHKKEKKNRALAETRTGSRDGREISVHCKSQHFPPQTSCLRSASPISVTTGPWQANDKQTNMCAK